MTTSKLYSIFLFLFFKSHLLFENELITMVSILTGDGHKSYLESWFYKAIIWKKPTDYRKYFSFKTIILKIFIFI